jgi:hypothetical protein
MGRNTAITGYSSVQRFVSHQLHITDDRLNQNDREPERRQ